MENRSYVVNGVGFGALFEAMVAQAEADIVKAEVVAQELAQDAREGLAEWLVVLRKLDIADAIIG